MTRSKLQTRIFVIVFAVTMAIAPIGAAAQTSVSLPKNKYKVQDDVDLGRKTASQIEQQFPILNNADAEAYVSRVGERLVANIPQQFQQPAFDYRFKVVNASDINAFALPGGPMYVNRGMIEAARNEGEMAGVMAHEIAHVALRHATAQATKQSSAGSVLSQLGLILGGAALAGQTGAQLGAMGAAAMMTKYSREYESQADTLGAAIMARAGYDPRDLANMFRTIESRRQGGRSPSWLSSHPDPGDRFQKINQEAATLNVSPNPIKITRDFERVRAELSRLAPAMTMAQIERNYGSGRDSGGGRGNSPMAGGRYSISVPSPSADARGYMASNLFRIYVPSNWREFPGNSDVTFAPDGAYGPQGITHGVMTGAFQPQSYGLRNATDTFVRSLVSGNSYLRQQTASTNAYVGSNRGYLTSLFGRSPVTNRNENVDVYTTELRDGRIFYLITVAPESESYRYDNAFRNVVSSVQLN